MPTPCAKKISKDSGILEQEAEGLLQRIKNIAQIKVDRENMPHTEALRQAAGEIKMEQDAMEKVEQRNMLLQLQKKRDLKDFAMRFKTWGEGIRAKIEGSSKDIPGGRDSVDYQAKALHGRYFGRLVAELDKEGVLKDFTKSKNVDLIYREMGGLAEGTGASVTGNENAFKIAKVIEDLYSEMIGRQNRAGAFVQKIPGYITRQTHDMMSIRALGNNQQEAYAAWKQYVFPLLDLAKTTKGADVDMVLKNIHEGLYTGIHGIARDEADINGVTIQGSLAKKVSQRRVLFFKDAESAYKYNQAFGIRDFKEAVLNDLHLRARSIALMENFGPSPELGLEQVVRELAEQARGLPDSAAHVDSLRDWRIQAGMNELTGRNEVPSNPTASHFLSTLKAWIQMSKMGAVTLSSFADKAFLQSEAAFQGMNNLHVLGKQLTGMFPRDAERKQFLRLLGVGMDGLIGNALSRYSSHSSVSGWTHKVQKLFFDVNLLNSWTDANKSSMGELMAAHLGEYADLKFEELPDKLSHVLSLYDISRSMWDALRSTAYAPDKSLGTVITPDKISSIPDEVIANVVKERGLNPTPANIFRTRDKMDTALRTYFQDRIDTAIPTPGVSERKWATMNTQAGTPLGEAVRMIMLFKSFPLTIMNKVVGREVYGHGADTIKQWLLSDHRGKFNLAMLMAMGTAAGYLSGVARDALKGKEPKPLIHDGKLNWAAVNDAALRGGALGLMGDMMLNDFDTQHNNFLSYAAGPIVGQLPRALELKTRLQQGEPIAGPAGKLLLDNAPLINLFYTRPILDYFVLWNLEEMLTPGTLRRRESAVEQRSHQDYYLRPSESVNR